MERRIRNLELCAERDGAGDLHWQPGFQSSPILAVAGVSLRGGVAEKEDIVSAAQCLGWRLVDTAEAPARCRLRLCRPEVIDLRTPPPG